MCSIKLLGLSYWCWYWKDKSYMGRYRISKKRLCRQYSERFVIGKRLLCCFIWAGISDFYFAGQSCTFRNIHQQLFFDWLADKKYRSRFLFVMHTVQYCQCMDGGRRFSRSVSQNALWNKSIYAGEFDCSIFIWYLAHCNADQKLCEWRNVICGNGPDGDRLYCSCRDYGNQMGASLPHHRKYMGRAWRPSIQ